MKKRAQLPDAYTFTMLFRGLSQRPHLAQSTSRALSIYQSMFAENSPVRPSIIHTNAILKVCALAHDVDALLGIAAELPTRGSGAPDNLTFTIILNAIRSKASRETNARERTEETALAVRQGRRLWLEVRQRWISGDLRLDEEFVCSMGRLLLLGHEAQDQDDVLSLLEQTMGIPRQIARLNDPALGRGEEAPETNDDSELPPCSQANIELQTLLSSPKEENDFPDAHSDPFAPLSSAARLTCSAVRPGCNTLSLVLEACIFLKYVRAAQNYWGLLTSPDGHHKIVPDSENYHMYLRLLRLRRSSKLAVELVDEMRSGTLTGWAGDVQTKTFRIALSCCVKDIKNRNSIVHAAKLVRMMMDTLPCPDAKALSMYLAIALNQEPRDWRVIMGVIRGTELGVRNLRSLIAYDPDALRKQNQGDILKLISELIRTFDVVLDLGKEEINDEERKRCKKQKSSLVAYFTRTNTVYEQLEVKRKSVEDGKVEDAGMGGKSTAYKKSRSGSCGDRYKMDGKGGSDGFTARVMRLRLKGQKGSVMLGLGKANGKANGRWRGDRENRSWKKEDSERKDQQRWEGYKGGGNKEGAERYEVT